MMDDSKHNDPEHMDEKQRKQHLRRRAEAKAAQSAASQEGLSPGEIKNLLHDYQVHQIELEMQNEQLRETQKQLEMARDRFARLFNDAPAGYLTIDANGIIAQVNQTFADMIGLEPHLLAGKNLGDFIALADRSIFFGRFKAFFNTPRGKQMDLRLRRALAGIPAGSAAELTVRCVGRIEHEVHPRLKHSPLLLMMIVDISAQIQAQEALRERERYLSAILETTQDGFWVLDAQGRVTDVNTAYCRMSGYTREELLRLRIQDLEALEDHEAIAARIQRIVANGSETFETRHRAKNGELFDVEVSVSLFAASGRTFVCFCREITDRKRVEAALRESETNYRRLIEGMPDIIYRFSREQGGLYWSPSVETVLGYSLEELHANPFLWNEAIHPEDRDKVDQAIQDSDLGNPFFLEYRIRDARGAWHWLHDRSIGHHADGNETIIEGLATDITATKNAEQKIQQVNTRLEQALAEKDKFFSIIAHDLKSPLSGFLASTRLMVDEPELFSQEEMRTLAESMRQSAENLYSLLENLLTWSQMQRGNLSFAPQNSDLLQLITHNLELIQAATREKNLDLHHSIPEGLRVHADPQALNTVLRNLLSNALKFCHPGGQVRVTASRDKNTALIDIADTGIGMAQEIADSIFSLDKKTSRPGTRGEKGTGLGLMLCKEFVEMHGGEIRVRSTPGQGTTFSFTIPLARSSHDGPDPA